MDYIHNVSDLLDKLLDLKATGKEKVALGFLLGGADDSQPHIAIEPILNELANIAGGSIAFSWDGDKELKATATNSSVGLTFTIKF